MNNTIDYQIFIPSGRAYEPPNISGVSHLLEHIIYDYDFSNNEFERYLDKNSIYDDAATGDYYTSVHFEEIDKSILEYVQKKIKHIILNPVISKETLHREKNIINEEIQYLNQIPEDMADSAFDKLVFQGTPLANPMIGIPSSVNALSKKDVIEWHKTFYKKNNIVEFIYDEHTDKLTVTPITVQNIPKITLKQKSGENIINAGFNSKAVTIGWHFSNPSQKERIILDILKTILNGTGQYSANYSIIGTGLVYEKNVYTANFNGVSLLYIRFFSTRPQEVISLFKKYKEKLMQGDAIKESFDLAKNKERDYFTLPGSDKVFSTGIEFMSTGELTIPKERVRLIDTITKKDAVQCAQKIFESGEFVSMVM